MVGIGATEEEKIAQFMIEYGGAYDSAQELYLSASKVIGFLKKSTSFAERLNGYKYSLSRSIDSSIDYISSLEGRFPMFTVDIALKLARLFGRDARVKVPTEPTPLVVDAPDSRYMFLVAPKTTSWRDEEKKDKISSIHETSEIVKRLGV